MQEVLNYDIPLISTRYARLFLSFLNTKNISKETITTHNKRLQESLNKQDGYLTINEIITLLKIADTLLDDEKASFEFGQQLDLTSYGLFGYMLMSKDKQSALINNIVNYIDVCLPLFDMSVSNTGHEIIIRFIDRWEMDTAKAFMTKIFMGSIHTIASKVCSSMHFDCDFSSYIAKSEWVLAAPKSKWTLNAKYNQVILRNVAKHSYSKNQLKLVYSLAHSREGAYEEIFR